MNIYNIIEVVSRFNGSEWYNVSTRKYCGLSKEVLDATITKKDQKLKEYYSNKFVQEKPSSLRDEIIYKIKEKSYNEESNWLNDLIGRGDLHIRISWEEINVLTIEEIEIEEDNYYNSKLVKEIL